MKKVHRFFNYTNIIISLLTTILICAVLLIAVSPNFSFINQFFQGWKTSASSFVEFPHYLIEWKRDMSRSQNMTVDIPLHYIPKGTLMNVNVLRASVPDDKNSELFGLSGLQGVWDQQRFNIENINVKYNQSLPTSDFTAMMERSFAMAALAGVRWVSVDFSWADIVATQDAQGKRQFDWSMTDRVFDTAKRYGMHLVPILAYSPYYARPQTAAYDKKCLPDDLTASGSIMYNEFVEAVVSRYQPNGGAYAGTSKDYGISQWIIWDEPNGNLMTDCDGFTSNKASSYAALFKGAYQTIHNLDRYNDSGLKVIMGGLTFAGTAATDKYYPSNFLRSFYRSAGTQAKPDILNVHYIAPEADGKSEASAEGLKEALDNFIDARNLTGNEKSPIWITRLGKTYREDNPGESDAFMDNSFNLVKNGYSGNGKNIQKVFWWPAEGSLTRSSQNSTLEDTEERRKAMIDIDFTPRQTYFHFAERWTHAFIKTGIVKDIAADDAVLHVKLSSSQMPEFNYEYALLAESPSRKAVLQLPQIVSLESVIAPNCMNVNGPTTVKLGQSGSYAANFTSPQKNLIGQLFYDNGDRNMNNLGKQNLSGTESTFSVNWTPETPGTYSICCSAWNGDLARCTPSGYDYGSTACAGPNTCMTVTVPARTASNMKMPASGEILSLSMAFVPTWEKYVQNIWMRTNEGIIGYTQKVTKNSDGTPDWDNADHWSRIGNGTLSYDQDDTMTGLATLMQTVWYPDGARTRYGVTKTNGTTDWEKNTEFSVYPFSGTPQSVAGETFTNPADGSQTFFQVIWIGDKEYFRNSTIDPDNHHPLLSGSWNGPSGLTGLPPNDEAGPIQAHDITLMPEPSNTVLERIVRGNILYWRLVPLGKDGMPDWSRAQGWIFP